MKTITLGELKTQVRQRADMENSTFISDDELTDYINKSKDELYDILVQKFGADYYTTYQDISLVSGTSEYSLPVDFYKAMGVDYQVTGDGKWITLRPFMFSERNRYNSTVRNSIIGAIDLEYRIRNDKLWFRNAPIQSGTARLWYIPVATDLSSDTDTIMGVNGWEEYVVIDAAIKCLVKEESDTTALRSDKQAMMQRIEAAAENRDAGSPQRVTDARSDDYYENWGWLN